MKPSEQFIEDYNRLRCRGLNGEQIQREMTEMGYPESIVEDWKLVGYNREWLNDLFKGSKGVGANEDVLGFLRIMSSPKE